MAGLKDLQPPDMSGEDYVMWRDLVQERAGLCVPESRQHTLRHALWQRMRELHVHSYNDYYQRVVYGEHGDAEWTQLLELLVISETSFFRHPPSYEALVTHALPAVMQQKRAAGRDDISIWSVACATGQEVYSLAMAFLKHADPFVFKLTVTGSDISARVLRKAQAGLYRAHELRFLPDEYRAQYLVAVEHEGQPMFQVAERVRTLTRFQQLNIMHTDAAWGPEQDIVFCQNVLIYFDLDDRRRIVRHLCKHVAPGGFLFLAPAEVVGLELPEMTPIHVDECVIYRRHASRGH